MHKCLTFMRKEDARGWLPFPSRGLAEEILNKQSSQALSFKTAFAQIHWEDTEPLYPRPSQLSDLSMTWSSRQWGLQGSGDISNSKWSLRVKGVSGVLWLYGLFDERGLIYLQLKSLTQHKAMWQSTSDPPVSTEGTGHCNTVPVPRGR